MKLTIKPDDLAVKLLTALLIDVGNQFSLSHDDQAKDLDYAMRRLRSEGLGFVTKTLPTLGKNLDLALKSGIYSPLATMKRRPKGAYPSFLKGLHSRIFMLNGTLLENPCPDAIRAIRQISFVLYKLELEFSEVQVDEKISSFVEVDKTLLHMDNITMQTAGYIYTAQGLMERIFDGLEPRDIVPRPGPGQTADRVAREARYEPHVRYDDVEKVYAFGDYFYSGFLHLFDRLRDFNRLPRVSNGTSKLLGVPKDSRGPRLICMVPHEYMWLQQGLGREMVKCLESHPLTRGRVNFTDQTINGNLALEASSTGEWATLDMKEASDRISSALVELCFDDLPELRDALLALSGDTVDCGKHGLLHKKKFAPMGSALCFPVMSVVHYVLMLSVLITDKALPLKTALESCYVYGDDLIIKTEHAQAIIDAFPIFGLRFNESKCCMTGKFRESCGIDAYDGIDVTPTRIKSFAFNSSCGQSLSRQLAVFHALFNRGLWESARLWQKLIVQTWGSLPRCTKDSAIAGWIVPKDKVFMANSKWRPKGRTIMGEFEPVLENGPWKYHSYLQTMMMHARVVKTQAYASLLGGWEQLLCSLNHCTEDSHAITKRDHTKIVWERVPLSSC